MNFPGQQWAVYSQGALITEILSGKDGSHTHLPDAKYPRWDVEADRMIYDYKDEPDYLLRNLLA